MLEGELHRQAATDQVVIAVRAERTYRVQDAASGDDLGTATRREVRRISVNNQLRRTLRGLIAGLRLDHAEVSERVAAIRSIAESGDAELRPLLDARRAREDNARVIDAIDTAMVVFDLDAEDEGTRLAAVRASANNLDGSVRIKLTDIAEDDGVSESLREAAKASLSAIEDTVARYQMVETVFFGLSLGSVLVLAAIGLSITFGVMGVINMAHGELIMLGAYTTYVIQTLMPDAIEYSLFVAVPAAFAVSGLVGIAIERGIIRFLYGRPLETLLATFGVSLILQQAVRSIFSPLNRAVSTPEWMSGSLQVVQGLSLTYNRLYILVFAGLVFAALWLVLRRTRLGLEVRAVTQNRQMARAVGVRSARVDMLTFGLGAGIAGVAGVALSQLTNVGPNLGQGYIVDSFLVVVFGGVGNLWGHLGCRAVPGRGQQADRTGGGGSGRQDPGAGVHHPVHSEVAPGTVSATGPGRRKADAAGALSRSRARRMGAAHRLGVGGRPGARGQPAGPGRLRPCTCRATRWRCSASTFASRCWLSPSTWCGATAAS